MVIISIFYLELGATLLSIGGLLTFIGLMLFFEPNLLRLGNVIYDYRKYLIKNSLNFI